ncbi:large ribosomal subunit protein eL8-like [Zophobas morio]|jgi:large subunit ribosomal protein L7Ae|uniref:large ribosomal subunit protein eL8-like n=1 Tax=Zophobas morio TaxID=2755281 RepID=UPI003083C1EC
MPKSATVTAKTNKNKNLNAASVAKKHKGSVSSFKAAASKNKTIVKSKATSLENKAKSLSKVSSQSALYQNSTEDPKTTEKRKKTKNPLFVKRPRNFGIGQDIQPRRDLTRFVKWPKYIRLQRQKAILLQRLKVPPSLNQFNKTLDKHTAAELFKFAAKYRPETKHQKKQRLLEAAQAKVGNKPISMKKPVVLKKGVNHITALVEQKKAKLVMIAHDVDPIEIVVWLPALCRKFGVPYCIVKGKARLGSLVHLKTATALAVTDVHEEDKDAFSKLVQAINAKFTEKWNEYRKTWGGEVMGQKSRDAAAKLQKLKALERSAKTRKLKAVA